MMLQILFYMLMSLRIEAVLVDKTYLNNAVAKGAVCLDGSRPVYHFDRGSGAGINSWLVHIEGGGWCHNITTCLAQKNLKQGSSKDMAKQLNFSGILSNDPQFNPGFRLEFINALTGIGVPTSRGYYINSCYTHCQSEGETWFRTHSQVLNDKTIAEAVGNWFYDRSQFQEIDCPYPLTKLVPRKNPTNHHLCTSNFEIP
ncbi:pectin acetylesterase 8-like [Olea europaea subsp. europaea]|nr:pectin acetylesterase 8-like [Olea europaea subsp. europaea]